MKKCFLKINILIIVCLFLGFFIACNEGQEDGVRIDGLVFASISNEINDKTNLDRADEIEGCVFWTKSGTYFHLSQDCHYLSRSKTLFLGTEEDARLEGKDGVCSACAKNAASSTEPSPDTNGNSNAGGKDPFIKYYYWTKNGSVYHSSPECRHIVNAENIDIGTIYEANDAGKEKLCSACEKEEN